MDLYPRSRHVRPTADSLVTNLSRPKVRFRKNDAAELSGPSMRALTNNHILGLQLPRWISLSHLHNPPRSRRPTYPLWIHRRLHTQCCPRCSDALLLERTSQQEECARSQDPDWEGQFFS
jgi:hypothetical protein